MIVQDNQLISRKVVENSSHPKLNTFYNACMNMDTINSRGTIPLMQAWNQIDNVCIAILPATLFSLYFLTPGFSNPLLAGVVETSSLLYPNASIILLTLAVICEWKPLRPSVHNRHS